MIAIPFSITEIVSDTRAGDNFCLLAECYNWTTGRNHYRSINWGLLLKDVPITRENVRKGNVGRPRLYT